MKKSSDQPSWDTVRFPPELTMERLLEATQGKVVAATSLGQARLSVVAIAEKVAAGEASNPISTAGSELHARLQAEPISAELESALVKFVTAMSDRMRRQQSVIDHLMTLIPEAVTFSRHEEARSRGSQKHVKNPEAAAKAAAKHEAKAFWLEREQGQHPKLRTEEQFAMEVIRRWPVLTSIGNVKAWSTAWRKEARRGDGK
ncbi:hypothetical protein [Lysobacter sp. A3-1-A15]|uniref:hypothetical protein n=1 Tax=Novilysobacter viscosus TaxID=3098602 RepID=UPI002ED9BED3